MAFLIGSGSKWGSGTLTCLLVALEMESSGTWDLTAQNEILSQMPMHPYGTCARCAELQEGSREDNGLRNGSLAKTPPSVQDIPG